MLEVESKLFSLFILFNVNVIVILIDTLNQQATHVINKIKNNINTLNGKNTKNIVRGASETTRELTLRNYKKEFID
jgi:hypothetical protein